jgi:hypothetical protein
MNLRAFCSALAPKYWRELARLFRNYKWERNDDGDILIGHATIGGVFECDAPDGLGVVRTNNLITTEGCNYLLSAGIAGGTQYTTFYITPFSGNVAVTDALTAANFTTTQTELTTQYTETTRVTFVESTPASKSTNNTASPATVTAAADSVSIWGLGLMSTSTKSATTGVLLAAAKYSTVRTLATSADTLGIKYTLTMANSA